MILDAWSKVLKQCYKCNKKDNLVEWRNTQCGPECKFAVCKDHVGEAMDSIQGGGMKCLCCGAKIKAVDYRSLGVDNA